MTAPTASFGPRPRPVHLSEERRLTLAEGALFGLGVLILVLYAQPHVAALMGYGDASAEGSVIRLSYLPAYAAALILAATCPWRTILAVAKSPLLVVLLAVTAASWFWSIDPAATFRRFIAVSFTTLGGVALAARFRWPRLAEICAAAFVLLGVGSLIMVIVKPAWGTMPNLFPGAWRGLWVEKNNLGGNMVVGIALCGAAAVMNPPRRWLWAACGALCLFLILASTSKTSLVVVALTFAAFAFVWLVKRGPTAGVAMAWTAVVGIGLLAGLIVFASDLFFGLLGKDATFTGRTEIWDGITRVAETRPWTGFGYGAIWDDMDPYAPLAKIVAVAGFRPHHAHNGWMELWLNLGIWGVVAFALWFVETWIRTIWSVFTSRAAWFCLPVLLGYSLAMLTESITLIWHDVRWLLFVLMAVKLALGDDPPVAKVRPVRRPATRSGTRLGPSAWRG